jgi:hypothetical protein
MKPFTLLLLFLALMLGLWVFLGHQSFEWGEPLPTPVLVHEQPAAPERDFGSDDEGVREEAEGLPVPIIPGTRVTEAKTVLPEAAGAGPRNSPSRRVRLSGALSGVRSISGRLSATVERARDDARLQLEHEVTEWLTPEVPTQWKPPAHLITRMIHKTDVHPIVRDWGTVYEATLETDFSSNARGAIVAAHEREVVARRLVTLAVAGYIRADEATKGYYTHWLRAVAAAGVGASGVVIYQLLT